MELPESDKLDSSTMLKNEPEEKQRFSPATLLGKSKAFPKNKLPVDERIPLPVDERIPLPVYEGGNQPEVKFVQGKPDCCLFKDYKGVKHGKKKDIVFIADIPLEERHKYIDPEQDINHPRMKIMGHAKNKLENPLNVIIQQQEEKAKEQEKKITTQEEKIKHMEDILIQQNKLLSDIIKKINGVK